MPTITSFPYTISVPGHYKVSPGVYYISTDGIIINSNDVFLDLTGSIIVHILNNGNTHKGIFWKDKTNIILSGGYFRNFFYGIRGDSIIATNTAVIENCILENCTFRGIRLYSKESTIRNNIIRNITGCTFYPNAYCFGIEVDGLATVQNNIIQDIYGMGTGEGVGISISENGKGIILKDNIISNKVKIDHTFGIWVGGKYTDSALISNNTISNFNNGITASSVVKGAYIKNTTLNCNIPYTISTPEFLDLGGNL